MCNTFLLVWKSLPIKCILWQMEPCIFLEMVSTSITWLARIIPPYVNYFLIYTLDSNSCQHLAVWRLLCSSQGLTWSIHLQHSSSPLYQNSKLCSHTKCIHVVVWVTAVHKDYHSPTLPLTFLYFNQWEVSAWGSTWDCNTNLEGGPASA